MGRTEGVRTARKLLVAFGVGLALISIGSVFALVNLFELNGVVRHLAIDPVPGWAAIAGVAKDFNEYRVLESSSQASASSGNERLARKAAEIERELTAYDATITQADDRRRFANLLAQGLKQTLADAADVGEIGEAADGQQALDLVRQGDWDAVVLDIGLPGRGGIEILKDIKHERPRLPVLILSMHPEDQYAIRALRAGAGRLSHEGSRSPRGSSKRFARSRPEAGSSVADLAERLAMELTVDAAGPPHASLSDREFEVLRLIGSGLSVGDIADRLSLSVKTVSTYRAPRFSRKCA